MVLGFPKIYRASNVEYLLHGYVRPVSLMVTSIPQTTNGAIILSDKAPPAAHDRSHNVMSCDVVGVLIDVPLYKRPKTSNPIMHKLSPGARIRVMHHFTSYGIHFCISQGLCSPPPSFMGLVKIGRLCGYYAGGGTLSCICRDTHQHLFTARTCSDDCTKPLCL